LKILAHKEAPAGWLLCDGKILKKKDYPILFELFKDQYGGNGVTTFKLPSYTVEKDPKAYQSKFTEKR